ncbi:GNAT family N-acetyltransferase [Solibacillus silvestris]|uniref:GNAT family N-acetyltransferase n=1 Tax=Solibacillus silvestris TaxID=76853 RepID=UPI003F7D8C34
MKFTDRSKRILKNAEFAAQQTTNIVYPVHILLAMLQERTGVCAELNVHYPKLQAVLHERIKYVYRSEQDCGIVCKPFMMNASQSTKQVLEIAEQRMHRYGQLFINEGHLADGIFKSDDIQTSAILESLDTAGMQKLVCTARDMIVPLRNYSLPHRLNETNKFRRAQHSDQYSLKEFVQREFGRGWVESIENGFAHEEIPIFIALDDEQIIGFASFDVSLNKKGVFGPMGTLRAIRSQKVGYTLLHICLKEMKDIGYEYAVLGEAGPLEFYEKACGAVVIPKN